MSPKRPLIQELPSNTNANTNEISASLPKRTRTQSPSPSAHTATTHPSLDSTPATEVDLSDAQSESEESSVVSSDPESESDNSDLASDAESDGHRHSHGNSNGADYRARSVDCAQAQRIGFTQGGDTEYTGHQEGQDEDGYDDQDEDEDEDENQTIRILESDRPPLPTRSRLLDRLREFMPRMKEDTERLVASGGEDAGFDIIGLDEGTDSQQQREDKTRKEEEGQFIEMDLELGVLEEVGEKGHTVDDADRAGGDDHDVLRKMMGRETKVGNVEVLDS